mgnify:FL=1
MKSPDVPITSEQRRILRHALGVDRVAKAKKGKAYRCTYTSGATKELEDLRARGLLYRVQAETSELPTYFVTVLGARVAMEPHEFLDRELLGALHWATSLAEKHLATATSKAPNA